MSCPAQAGAREERGGLELADIFRAHGHELPRLHRDQSRAAGAIVACRTEALGGHVEVCDRCGHRQVGFNSCRNRHCPKCHALDQAEWLDRRTKDLLPVEYYHVVFTIPEELHAIFLASPRTAYDLLFASVAATLREAAAANLAVQAGFLALLHTWTQQLLYHPHIHCIVPGGGPSIDGSRWLPCARGFFIHVKKLSQLFRGKLLASLEKAIADERIVFRKQRAGFLLRAAAAKDWVVYAKRPFAGPEQVLKYLGRYTHRIAISNDRLVSLEDGRVTFRWKDRAHGGRRRVMTLAAGIFLRRFLLHVLPARFVKIRGYGFLANGCKTAALARCRDLLGVATSAATASAPADETWQERFLRLTGKDVTRCPSCRVGRMILVEEVAPGRNRIWSRIRGP